MSSKNLMHTPKNKIEDASWNKMSEGTAKKRKRKNSSILGLQGVEMDEDSAKHQKDAHTRRYEEFVVQE